MVPRPYMRRTPNHAGSSDMPARPIGRGHRNQPPLGRRRWTDQEITDLLVCYELSKEGGRGFMERLRRFWLERYPDSDLTAQHLRDQAMRCLAKAQQDEQRQRQQGQSQNNQRGRGRGGPVTRVVTSSPEVQQSGSGDLRASFARITERLPVVDPSPRSRRRALAPRPMDPVDLGGQEHQPEDGGDERVRDELLQRLQEGLSSASVDFIARRNLSKPKRKIRVSDLSFVNEVLGEVVSDQFSLEQLDCAVYVAAEFISSRQARRSVSAEEKIKRKIQELDERMTERRREASRIQVVMDALRSGIALSRKVKFFIALKHVNHPYVYLYR